MSMVFANNLVKVLIPHAVYEFSGALLWNVSHV